MAGEEKLTTSTDLADERTRHTEMFKNKYALKDPR